MTRPKIFVVFGMPRTGTTYLYHALARHPRIFVPYRKESYFFSVNHGKGEDWFRSLYKGIGTDQIGADINPLYYLDADSIDRILAYDPNVKVILAAVSANDVPGESGSPGGLFDEVSAGTQIEISWKLGELPGTVRPAFLWTSKDPVALDNDLLLLDLARGIAAPAKDDNWVVNLNLDQYLYMPEPVDEPELHTAAFDKQPEGIGVFFRFSYTPEDRNPWNWFVSGGIAGRGVVPSRPFDRYGIGVYALFESDDLKDQPLIGGLLDTEWGTEVFYNLAITRWLQLSPSVQYIQSGLPGVDESVVVATRLQIDF